jgi:hypothetical protein
MTVFRSFIDRVLAGEIKDVDNEVDDAIDAWHNGDSGMELHQWLGLTKDEYKIFITTPSVLHLIIVSRSSRIFQNDI